MNSASQVDLYSNTRFDQGIGRRVSVGAFIVSAAFTALSIIGALGNLSQLAFSWLFAFTFAFTLAVGSLFWCILHNATDSEWGVLVRRQMENLSSPLWLLPVLFLPLVVFCAPLLWKWWDLASGVDPLLDAKSAFLNKGFFTFRTFFYLVSLAAVSFALHRQSTLQDRDGLAARTYRLRRISIIGLPVLAVCLTFAAVDWLMALDYHWFSTMWGVYVFAGSAGSSMALLVLVVIFLRSRGFLAAVGSEHFHVMGKFLLAFTVFWGYIGFSQYMLIWYANIPEETIYFKLRNTGSWHLLSSFLVVGRFFLPFPVLLFQTSKKSLKVLGAICVWIVVMQLLDVYIIVMPSLHSAGFAPSIYDLTCLIAVMAAFVGFFFRTLTRGDVFPTRDPRLQGSVNVTN